MAAPAAAQPVQFSAVVTSEAGYAINPRLQPGVERSSTFISGTAAPRLLYKTEKSSTELQGKYSRETYLNGLGYTDSGSIGLVRTDQLSQFLTSTLTGRFLTSNRATIDPDQIVEDPLTIGRRTKTLIGGTQLQWQASARDQFSYGTQILRQTYGSGGVGGGQPSGYTQYSLNGGYNRVIDARTSAGVQLSMSTTRSKAYPASRVFQPAFTAKRQLSAVWTIDGHVGVVLQHVYGPFPRSSTSLGLGLNLCAVYPLTHFCVQVSRDTAPSGYGALRVATQIAANMSRELDEHSRVSFSAQYLKSSSNGLPTGGIARPLSDSTAILTSVDYDRDISRRISAGFGGRYQRREVAAVPNAQGYTATIHVSAKLGRM